MIDHTGIGVADVGRSAKFYDAALGELGMRRVAQIPENAGTDAIGYGLDHPVFWIDRFHPRSIKQHTAFAAKSKTEVEAFYAAALKAGGTTEHRDCANNMHQVTMPHSCSIQMATTSRRSAEAHKPIGVVYRSRESKDPNETACHLPHGLQRGRSNSPQPLAS
jgi:catechol 2,3-dioxygenase-like lactoylglutathione lyase family enzyme